MIGRRAAVLYGVVLHAILMSSVAAYATEPFTLAVTPLSQRIESGSRVELDVALTNTSDHDLNASSMYQGSGNESCQIEVRDSSGNRLKRLQRPDDDGKGLHSSDLNPPLKPNESVKDWINVTAFYDLTDPGEYTIELSRQLGRKSSIVRSNVVTVTILPRAKP